VASVKGQLHKLAERLFSRLARSQHVFLAGLAVAFSIEIVVDWNSTFYEVNVLRAQLREKAVHYVSMMRLAAEDPLASHDNKRLRELIDRVLEDDEVCYVRIADPKGNTLVDAGAPLSTRYPKQLKRDIGGMLADPAALRERIAGSRHRDIFQAVTDTEDKVVHLFTTTVADPISHGMDAELAYQDRLYDEKTRDEDRAVTWGLALISRAAEDPARPRPQKTVGDDDDDDDDDNDDSDDEAVKQPAKKPAGLVLIALRTDHLRKAVRKKLIKGGAITIFFLFVILFQQLSARRAKMKLISLTDALGVAREAIASALPEKPPEVPGVESALAFEQAERIGGTVYDVSLPDPANPKIIDVFLACPEGSGVDVAFASVFIRDEQRRLRKALHRAEKDPTPDLVLRDFLAAYSEAPIHRRLDLLIFRIDLAAGVVRGVLGGLLPPEILDGNGDPQAARFEELPADTVDEKLVEPPVRRFEVAFPANATLLVYSDGLEPEAHHPLTPSEVRAKVAAAASKKAAEIVEELREVTKRKATVLTDDLFVLLMRRAG
jgi:hypothetical protein